MYEFIRVLGIILLCLLGFCYPYIMNHICQKYLLSGRCYYDEREESKFNELGINYVRI